jgi:hypothetical protein
VEKPIPKTETKKKDCPFETASFYFRKKTFIAFRMKDSF